MISPPSWLALLALSAAGVQAEAIADPPWRFTLEQPGSGWERPGFDDSAWKSGAGGFGERDTPGIRVGTTWATPTIWLRRTVELGAEPEKPALYVFHDEDAVVYLNGRKVAEFSGYTTEYQLVPLEGDAAGAAVAGENVLAVHCRQTTGGQGIDVHLIDSDRAPELPRPPRPEKPFVSELITEWGAAVTAENAWREYPRPNLVRPEWTNLNGHWQYAITPIEDGQPDTWEGEILVPFAVESKLSGVQRLLHDDQALWYRRPVALEPPADGRRLLLHFEASDYHTRVWLNGAEVGEHTGGNTPFSFDVTDALADGAEQDLVVRVTDATGGFQLRGKQTDNPRGIWYTQVSGLWGTVWAEEVPARHIERLVIEAANGGTVAVTVEGSASGEPVTVVASRGGSEVARAAGTGTVALQIPDPQLWSPDSPALYDLAVTAGGDSVTSYVGLREVGRAQDEDGHWRFTLNGEPLFHWGPLDQGWWPDGLLTPPSDAAMRWDVDYLKAAGFNMIRKHIKVEPRRFYAYCDQVGMMVWQDHVSGGPSPDWTRLQPDPEDAEWPDAAHEQFMLELDRMITALENHPSIVVWVPFNEAWGQHRTVEAGDWTVERDPSRHVNIASGGNFWPAGHIVDAHRYPHPGFPFEHGEGGRFDGFIKVMGEFGGHGLPTPDHLWDNSRRNWGYGGLPQNAAEYRERYVESLRILTELQKQGIAGGVYTQTTDVEGEINGLVTYDRKRIKLSAEELAELHRVLFE